MEKEPNLQEGEQDQHNAEYEEDAPRIYVASLSDYNDGRLHGRWINAAQAPEEIQTAIQDMLATSPEPGAEEYAIHDYENFGPLRLEEYESIETVARLAQGIAEHGSAFAHWVALVGESDAETLRHFEEAYRGHFDSVIDYASELFDDLGYTDLVERVLPDHLQPYVRLDVEGFARDLELSGDIVTSEGDGGVYIFDAIY